MIKSKEMDAKGNESRKNKLKPRDKVRTKSNVKVCVHFLEKGHKFDFEHVCSH